MEDFERLLLQLPMTPDTKETIQAISASHRALHSQVTMANTFLLSCPFCLQKEPAENAINAMQHLIICGTKLQARITALEAERDQLADGMTTAADLLREAQQRITQLEKVIADAAWDDEHRRDKKRIEQLEGALKACIDVFGVALGDGTGMPFDTFLAQVVLVNQHAQHALTPEMLKNAVRKTLERDNQLGPDRGVYREWCRDPKLCQDKGTCPKDPTCAD